MSTNQTLAARLNNISSTTIVYGVLVVAIILGAVVTGANGGNLFSSGNLDNILNAMVTLGFVAIGQTLVILVGSLDLSVPFVLSLASVVSAGIMAGQSGKILPAVLLTLGLAAAIGLANGLIVTGLKVHGFVATLGTGLIISGYLGTNYQGSHGNAPSAFQQLDNLNIALLPLPFLIMIIFAVGVALMLRRTRLGHQIYAVGGSADVARMSGLRTNVPIIAAHVMCSLLAAIAGLFLVARLDVGQPTQGQQGVYDLMSIAAVVLGGTLLAGGKGNIAGTIAGVAIFAVLDNVMAAIELDPFLRDGIKGIVIVAAVAVYARRSIERRPARFDRASVLEATPGVAR